MHMKVADAIISEKEISHSWKKWFGLLCSILAIVFGCLWYVPTGWDKFFTIMNWPWGGPSGHLNFVFPGFLNSLWGLCLCFPLYLRGFIPSKGLSFFFYLSFTLNFLLLSVIAQLLFGANDTFVHNTMSTAFLAGLALSWIGMRSIAGFGWLIVFILAIINLISADNHLKNFGFFFILFTFSSLLFQSEFSPKNLFGNILSDFRGLKDSKLDFVKESMQEAIITTGNTIKAGAKMI